MKEKNQKRKVFCDITKCLGCKACEIACAVEHSTTKDLFLAIGESPKPVNRRDVQTAKDKVVSIGCRHCEEAACVDACMSGSMYKDPETGLTMHDEEKCVGCWMCVMTCPFGVIRIETERKIALKCDLCPDKETPTCVEACPTKALFVGTAEEFEKRLKQTKPVTKGKK